MNPLAKFLNAKVANGSWEARFYVVASLVIFLFFMPIVISYMVDVFGKRK